MTSRRSLLLGAGAGAVLVSLGAGVAIADSSWLSNEGSDRDSQTPTLTQSSRNQLVAVTRGSLTTDHEFNATVSFGDSWILTTDAEGIVTRSRPAGTVIQPSDSLVWIDDRPLLLAAGEVPMYRELLKIGRGERDEAGDRRGLLEGPDVEQLQQFLLDAGFDGDGGLVVDGTFGPTTETAVKDWQTSVGHPRTGRVDTSQIIFAPRKVRVASDIRTGDRFATIEVTEAVASVIVDTSNRDRSALPIGATVRVQLADGTTHSGEVVEQEQVDQDGQRVWRTTVSVEEALSGDATTATLTATQVLAEDVLVVPVGALLALAEGGFALEVSTGDDTTRLERVTVGEVLDGRAEIDGDISEGDLVVVPV